MAADADTLVGRTLAKKYQLLRSIGAGGMGVVFEAIHIELHKRVALKVLLETDARSLARFGQEALATAKLDSPHIVRVIDFDARDRSHPFIVMELLDGESLRQAMRRVRPVPLPIAVSVATQLLGALATAHRAGIVHRDVKPANVFLERSAEGETNVKLLDFGIAKLAAEAGGMKTTAGAILGTPAYLAPEQIMGGAVDGRTDLHAVGVLLYEMLLGKRPWDGRKGAELGIAIAEEPVPPLLREDIPADLEAIIMRALAKDPAERFADADAMCQALRAFLSAESTSATKQREGSQASHGASAQVLDVHDTVRDPPRATAAPATRPLLVVKAIMVALVVATSISVIHSEEVADEEEAARALARVTRSAPAQVAPVPPAFDPSASGDPAVQPPPPAALSSKLLPRPRGVAPHAPPSAVPSVEPSMAPSVAPAVSAPVVPAGRPRCNGAVLRDPFTGTCEERF